MIGMRVPTYFWRRSWSRHLFHLLIKDRLDTLPHGCDGVFSAIEFFTVLDDQTEIDDEFCSTIIARVFRIGIWFLRIGARELAFNSGKIHRSCNNVKIVGDIKRDRVDGPYERSCILKSFQTADSRLGIAQLSSRESRGARNCRR